MTARRTSALFATALLAATASVGLATSAQAANASDTVVINCVGKKVVKPKEIVVTCADANVAVQKISWKRWGLNSAVGTGTLSWNTCLPTDCASGTVQTYPVRVTLSRLASGPNVTAFTKMTLAFPKGGPASANTASYLLDNQLAS
jgi:hypothetical protein